MRFLRRALASRSFVPGAILFALIVCAAIFAPSLAPYSPTAQDLSAGLLPPSSEHLFGTDQLGRDVFSRVLFAARTDLGIAFAAAIFPFIVGVTAGLISGYFGRQVDWMISRITDTVIAFPFYVLVIALVFALGAGAGGIIVAFAIVGWVGYARVVRSLTASMREQGWVRAARGGGLSDARVLVRHVLPNVLSQAIVLLATEIVLIMVAIVTLGYLGLGVQPPTPDWGTMIADGQAFVTSHWWLSALPGVAVVITGVALSLLGDGLGDAMRVTDGGQRGSRGVPRGKSRSGSRTQIHPAADSASHPAPASGSLIAHAITVEASRSAVSGLGKHQIATRGLSDERPADRLVDNVDLEVAPGGALGIVGESGSGKSLTLRAIAGLLPSGVHLEGGEFTLGGHVGMIFQDPLAALDPLTRVGAQLREACQAAGARSPHTRVLELLADVRLGSSGSPDVGDIELKRIARSYPHELSGGQRQRVVIAMALAGNPSVLLADEPTTALDVTVQREVLALLDELRRERGLTLVLVSHDLAVVASVCEHIAVMRDGRIVERGATLQVLTAPEHSYTRMLIEAVPELPEPELTPFPGSIANSTVVSTTDLTATAAKTVLALRDVKINYGRTPAVSGISFEVHGSLGLVGESGSGKTTIARAIAGELRHEDGTIEFDGALIPPGRRSKEMRTNIQLIPQDPASSLNPRRTTGDAIAEVLRVNQKTTRGTERTRVAELLMQVGLDAALANSYPHELSGGQRQRVAIARALAVNPRLLIADEATSALDVSVQAEIITLLKKLRETTGLALLVISHDLAVVNELCDAVVVLRAGRIIEQGSRVLADPQQTYTRELLAAVPRLPAV
ncbi:MAG: ATP-binding cassette domain-containing protein [Leucobacter sp.]